MTCVISKLKILWCCRYQLLILYFIYRSTLLSATAETFLLENEGRTSVVGALSFAIVQEAETLIDIARQHDLGYDELIKANLNINRWVPKVGERVLLPKQHVLPDAPYDGIVLNLAELRLYYFPPSELGQFRRVYTYPISIGRMDWKTPIGQTRVIRKEANPAWYPPVSIQEEHLEDGEVLPKMIPGGIPENPLGKYALKLALPGYLIHGTDEKKEFGIGMRVTHGCIRMYSEDIEELYGLVQVGTKVLFVDQPVKAGWKGASLFVQVHTPLKEDIEEFKEYTHRVGVTEIQEAIDRQSPDAEVDEQLLEDIIRVGDGVPIKVVSSSSGLPPVRR